MVHWPLDRLETCLGRGLSPLYLIHGDEPLQLSEGTALVRRAALKAGYCSRSVFFVDAGFKWDEFVQEAECLSLFSERRLIELRLAGGGLGRDGAKALQAFADCPPADTVLLIAADRLPKGAAKSAWFQALSRRGLVLQVRLPQGGQLLQWLARRSRQKGLGLDEEGLKILASRVEGNLLAAAQEIDKLHVLFGSARLEAAQVLGVVADSARFDVFNWAESCLQGNLARAWRMLTRMEQEGVGPALVLWALSRELRVLLQALGDRNQGRSLDQGLERRGAWGRRKQSLQKASRRLNPDRLAHLLEGCALVDRVIKGALEGDPWQSLREMCVQVAGPQSGAGFLSGPDRGAGWRLNQI